MSDDKQPTPAESDEPDALGPLAEAEHSEEAANGDAEEFDLSLAPETEEAGALLDSRPGLPAAGTPRRQTWERLWTASLQSPWTSLALVPALADVPVQRVAEALVAIGGEYRGRPVELIDARGLNMARVRELSERVGAVHEPHACVVMLDCPLDSQSALILARAASAALLVVPIGPTPLAEARRAVETVGRPRFIGAVTLQEHPP